MSPNRHQHCIQTERSDIPHDPHHLGVPSSASKMISEPMVRSKQTMHLSCVKIRTIPESPKRASTCASSPSGTIECVQNNLYAYGTSSANHAPIMHRHQHCLQMERSYIPHDPRHLGVPSGASKMIVEPMLRSTQTVFLSCVKISTISKRRELSLEHRYLGYHQVRPK